MERVTRRGFIAATVGVSLAGCSGSPGASASGGENKTTTEPTTTESPTTVGTVVNGVPLSASTNPVEYNYEELKENVMSGGPPKDGIPSIDEPKFWTADKADQELKDVDVVFGLVRNGEVKAYPQRILVHHEITNDVVGDEPVSITYCPLTGTVMGFRRGETTFGVSGNLLNNNLVMYDRQTDSRWPQILGTAISGKFQADSLQEFRLIWTTWKEWKEVHPDTKVLSDDTGHVRNYENDPYGSYVPEPSGYYTQDTTLFPPLKKDDRLPMKAVIIGARPDAGRIAFEKSVLREKGLLSGTVGGTPHVAVYEPELDTAYVYRNPDSSSFSYKDGQLITDDGSKYHPANLPLDRVYAFDAMWFAWSGFYPSTELIN